MVLECAYCPLGSIDAVIIGLDQLVGGAGLHDGGFDGLGGLIVHDVQLWFEAVIRELRV
jgi:hypothetical protein